MSDAETCDVAIVGGGPVGIALALLLAADGVNVVVAEKSPQIYPLPRAAHIDHETVRIFQAMGVADEIMATSRSANRYDFLTAQGEVLMRFEMGAARTPSGWPASNMIHQPSIEATMRARLAGHGNADLRSNWSFETLRESPDSVVAHFATPDGAKILRAQYLVGCDGARSSVREACGITFRDLDFDEPWLVIDTIVHDATRLPDINLQICDPARPTTCVLMGRRRHRWEFMLKPGETAEQALDDGFIAALVNPWKVDGAVTLERKAVYRFHALVAERWRAGRVLIAGDAAHQMPPFAGQGLCSGVRDAANLAWKLGAVIRGETDATILDTYQPEREPHVRAIIDLALLMGRTVCITDPAAAAARDKAMLAQRKAGGGPGSAPNYPPIAEGFILKGASEAGEYFPQPSTAIADRVSRLDDALGRGAWLIARDPIAGKTHPSLRAFALDDPRLQPFARNLDAWLSRRGAEAVLVRPDRYVFGCGKAEELAAAWTRATA